MTLQSGARIGPYEIVAAIGAGGMGEVYRARDSRLQRDVALKILPELVAADPERLLRFQREAQVLASLNHPHIAHIHGVEESNSTRALVMELVDGPTLAERIVSGPIPIEEALPIARQIAEALEAAHEAGIIHRDLKPANIKVRPDGTVKVLDFGLAKTLLGGAEVPLHNSPVITNSPTFHSPLMTGAGVILGTAAYMSPEQAKGKAVDRRADIWAFGAVLFEMLTGRTAFAGETVTELLASIVKDDPEWSALPAATPLPVRRLLRRCLEKEPGRRLRHAGDASLEIDEALSSGDTLAPGPAKAGSRRWRHAAITTAALIAAAAAGGAVTRVWRPADAGPPLRKFQLLTALLDRGAIIVEPVISRDGRRVAYTADRRLWIRDLDRVQPFEVAGARGATALFFSPDGRAIGFGRERQLWTLVIGSAEAALICSIPETGQLVSAAWSPDGTIAFAVWRGGLYTVPARGGEPTSILPIDPKREVDFHQLSYSPDGKTLMFAAHRVSATYAIEVLATSGRKTILEDAAHPRYSASTGHLLHVRNMSGRWADHTLWAAPFDASTGTMTGTGFPVQRGVDSASVADDGTLMTSSFPRFMRQLTWINRLGSVEGVIGKPQLNMTAPALSPEGHRVAVSAETDDNMDIWIQEVDRGTAIRLLSTPDPELAPAWSPGGDRLLFVTRMSTLVGTSPNSNSTISIVKADGSDSPRPIAKGTASALTHDGRHVIYTVSRSLDTDLWYSRLTPDGRADGEPMKFLETSAYESRPTPSPDRPWIAYVANESGQNEVYVRRFPDGSGRLMVSRGGGSAPRWRKDGRELYFLQGELMMAVEVDVRGSTPTAGVPRQLFNFAKLGVITDDGYDVTADGKRFVMMRDMREGSAPPMLTVVQNWFAEFRSDNR